MDQPHAARPGYVTIWVWLVMLLLAGMAVFAVPFSKTAAVVLIFAIATVKATLVVRNYMHLKQVPPMLYVLFLVPIALAILLAITLVPDIAFK